MIDLSINNEVLDRAINLAREREIIIPTFKQQRDPQLIPESIKNKLKTVGLWDITPVNLFRINWHNQPLDHGGGYGDVNYVEFPKQLTGTNARIVAMVGKWFPTGAHKVGAPWLCVL